MDKRYVVLEQQTGPDGTPYFDCLLFSSFSVLNKLHNDVFYLWEVIFSFPAYWKCFKASLQG